MKVFHLFLVALSMLLLASSAFASKKVATSKECYDKKGVCDKHCGKHRVKLGDCDKKKYRKPDKCCRMMDIDRPVSGSGSESESEE